MESRTRRFGERPKVLDDARASRVAIDETLARLGDPKAKQRVYMERYLERKKTKEKKP